MACEDMYRDGKLYYQRRGVEHKKENQHGNSKTLSQNVFGNPEPSAFFQTKINSTNTHPFLILRKINWNTHKKTQYQNTTVMFFKVPK